MSKRKTKQAHRELKRDKAKKLAKEHRKVAKASTTIPSAKAPPAKKQKQQYNATKMTSTPDVATPLKPHVQASQKHAVPFGTYDHILLVGEGDFSFARSLVVSHGCANVMATSYDNEDTVREKYPSFSDIESELKALTPPVPIQHSIDATKLSSYKELRCQRSDDSDNDDNEAQEGVAGTGDGWDTIAFMFPHVGGLSTDVNRQVRSNQALLVSFFKSCLETSTPKQRLARLSAQRKHAQSKLFRPERPFLRMGGRIIVTLFENEPYTLWNIRDLARHAGLKVKESWKFDAGEYPGYAHVRTLGAIEGGGGWKGEDREARVYVFEKMELVADSEEEKELEKVGLGKEGRGKGEKRGDMQGGQRQKQKQKEKESKKRARESDSEDEG